jgi:hypothetical protein
LDGDDAPQAGNDSGKHPGIFAGNLVIATGSALKA